MIQKKIKKKRKSIQDEMNYFLDKFLLGIRHRFKRQINYEPLKITFYLSSPISLTHPWLHFDGLVSHLLMIDAMKNDYFLIPRKFPFSRMLKGINLPQHPIKQNNEGLYHASVSIFDTDRKALEIIYKKFEDRWAGGKKKIYRGSGWSRDYMIQNIYIPTRTVVFYVNADFKEMKNLCSLVTGLGDNVRIGWGRVSKYMVEQITHDYSLVKDGLAMRPIPVRMCSNSEEIVSMAWKPPYWASENVEPCCVPFTKIVIDK